MPPTNPQIYRDSADLLFNEREVSNAIETVATSICKEAKNDFPVILSVMNGAFFFTGQLIPKLNFPLEVDYIHATRYQQGTEGKDIKWLAKPKISLNNRNVLLLDDILDKGITLKAIVDMCYDMGARKVTTAVLVEKELNEPKVFKADYVGLVVPNRYVFGCGMDVYGWWRNLPAIHALKIT